MRSLSVLPLLALLLFLFVTGCTKEPEFKKAKFEVIDKTRAYRNALLPPELRGKLLEGTQELESADVKKDKKKEDSKEEHKEEKEESKVEHKEEKKEEHKSDEPKSVLSDIGPDGFARMKVNVFLIEKTPGVLKHNNFEFQYGPGGGALDLMEFVDDKKKGSFHIAFEVDPAEEGELSVWYVSNAKTRKVMGEVIGSGCSSYFDITKHFLKEMKKSGFMVNTTDQRYVSALSGQYYLKIKNDKRIAIAIIDINDSRYHSLECR